MSKEKLKAKRGITLIALVITIIVMLILVAATVTVALNGGLFKSAKKATADTEAARVEESGLSNGQVNIDSTIYNSIEEYVESKPQQPKTAAELFDVNSEKKTAIEDKEDTDFITDGKLHIGDFINYHAGTWTSAEIEAIKTGKNGSVSATGSKQKPNVGYQFGGFSPGDSRDSNAPACNSEYDYLKDENGNPIFGWRLLNVNETENTMDLISAGCPEDFYLPYSSTSGYIAQYILTGIVDEEAINLSLPSNYPIRSFSPYVDTEKRCCISMVCYI